MIQVLLKILNVVFLVSIVLLVVLLSFALAPAPRMSEGGSSWPRWLASGAALAAGCLLNQAAVLAAQAPKQQVSEVDGRVESTEAQSPPTSVGTSRCSSSRWPAKELVRLPFSTTRTRPAPERSARPDDASRPFRAGGNAVPLGVRGGGRLLPALQGPAQAPDTLRA